MIFSMSKFLVTAYEEEQPCRFKDDLRNQCGTQVCSSFKPKEFQHVCAKQGLGELEKLGVFVICPAGYVQGRL